jgi:regulator of sigma E protease
VNTLIAILGLALLILIHEAGHFFTARAVGISPRRFYVGFPPPLVRVRRKGIEYGIGAIPLGGYVKLPGMHRPAPGDVEVHFGRALSEAPQLVAPIERVRRSLEEGDLAATRTALPELQGRIEDARLSPAAAKGANRGLRELNEGLADDAYWRQPAWKRILVIFAGPGTNLVFAILLFAALFMLPVTGTVASVLGGSPAARAGLKAGDTIKAIDGKRVAPLEIPRRIAASRGRALTLTVDRDGRLVRLMAVPEPNPQGVYRLGFALSGQGRSPPDALVRSLEVTWLVTEQVGVFFTRIVQGEGSEEIASPVGITQVQTRALERGIDTFLFVLGLISLSLALLNLLPLLPLDGGHIAFSIVEGLRGRAVGRAVYERVSVVGIALVLMLFFIGLSNDIGGRDGG